jgi:hypothetical protein
MADRQSRPEMNTQRPGLKDRNAPLHDSPDAASEGCPPSQLVSHA